MGTLGSLAGRMFATKGRVVAASALFAFAAAVLLVLTGLAQAQNGTFSNTAAISVPGANTSGNASPYPSTINVSETTGDIDDVNVTLTGVEHTNPDDIDVLLVGPAGQNVRLVSDAGGTTDVTGVNLTLDDEATGPHPDSMQLTTGTYTPTNHGTPDDVFSGSGVSESTPFGANLSVFDGSDPNGDWDLYVGDDTSINIGEISGGWSIEISTDNDPPVIETATGGTADEGSPAEITVEATDEQSDTLFYAFDCGNNGNFTDAGDIESQLESVGECTFDDNGSYTVGVEVSDGKANGTDTATATVTVNNVAPTAMFGNDGPINEGGTTTVSFTNADDPSNADTTAGLRYEYRCDGSEFTDGPDYDGASTTNSGTATCEFGQDGDPDGNPEVSARIIDKDDGATAYTTTVVVNNVEPTIESVTTDATEEEPVAEGSPATITVEATDPGTEDTLTYSFDCDNDGTTYETESLTSDPTKGECTFDDEGTGTYTVGVKVADDDDSATDSTDAHVRNVAPEITLTGGELEANEGDSETYSFSIADPGDDTQTINAVCGVNSVEVPASYEYDPQEKQGSFECRFPNGPANAGISVDADDGDGGEDVVEESITVANVAPVVTIMGDGDANEGQTKTYEYTVTDDGDNDTIENVEESCGGNADYTDTEAENSFDCTFIDGGMIDENTSKDSTLSVEATDNDGDTGIGAKTVSVANVRPTISLAGDDFANEGQTKTYNFTIEDDGVNDTHADTITTACSGPDAEKVLGSQTYDPEERTGSFECKFLDGGAGKTSDVTATVTDNDGDADMDEQSITVDIANVDPTISAIEDQSIDENTDTGELDFTIADDGDDTLMVAKDSSNTDLVPLDGIVISGTGANRIVKVTPATDMNGEADITLTVGDGDEASEEFKVTVRPVNSQPTAGSVTPDAVDEDADNNEVEIDLTTGAADDETPNAGLTYDIEDPTSEQGTLEQKMEGGNPVPGVFVFDPAPDYNTGNGTLDLEYAVTDRGDPDECVSDTNLDTDTGINDDGCDAKQSDTGTIPIDVDPINDAPTFALPTDKNQTIDEDPDPRKQTVAGFATAISKGASNESGQTLTFDVSSDETTSNGGPLFADGEEPAIDPDTGDLTYTPADNANGTATVTVVLIDDGSGGDGGEPDADGNDNTSDGEQTFTITVNAVNDPPVANDADRTVDEDDVLEVNVFTEEVGDGNTDKISSDIEVDRGEEGAALNLINATQGADGEVRCTPNGACTYTPDEDYNNTPQTADSFTYTARDAGSGLATGRISVTVASVADDPIANDDPSEGDTLETGRGVALQDIDVLANDTDADGDTISIFDFTDPVDENGDTAGAVTKNNDDTFTFTPNSDFFGTATFTYRAKDFRGTDADADEPNGVSDEFATVTITVIDNNESPVAVNDEYLVDEGATLTTTDADGTAEDPDANDPNNDGVLANDEDDDELFVSDSDGDPDNGIQPESGPQQGMLDLDADGTFVYTPDDLDFFGTDTFTYRADDRRGNNNLSAEPATTVTITVNNGADNPVANDDPTANTSYQVNEDGTLTVNIADGLIANDTDADNLEDPKNAGLTAVQPGDPENGSLTLNPNGSFTYTPDANENGPDSFTYRAKDGTDRLSELATVSISVSPVADAPVARLDNATTAEDTPKVINVLGNDDNFDGGPLTVTIAADPEYGAASVVTQEMIAEDSDDDLVEDDLNSILYTPDANYHGDDDLTYEVCDSGDRCDQAQVRITVTPVNDAPVADDDSYATDDDETLTVNEPGILDNDTDVDNEGNSNAGLTVADGDNDSENGISPSEAPTKGSLTLDADGSFEYTPNANATGADTFTYSVADGDGGADEADVTIEINTANRKPVAEADNYTVLEDGTLTADDADGAAEDPNENDPNNDGVLANDEDNDGPNALTAQLVDNVSDGQLTFNAQNGTFDYEPDEDFNGSDSFTYRANDGAAKNNLSDVTTVDITVRPKNDNPYAEDAARTTDEDGDDVSIDLSTLVDDIETPNSGLDYELTEANGATLSGSILTYDPADNFNTGGGDPVAIRYKVTDKGDPTDCDDADEDCDGAESATGTLNITVRPVNDAPVANDDPSNDTSYEVAEDGTLTVPVAQGVLANDTDADDDGLSAMKVADPDHGTVRLAEDGSFVYEPDEDFNGSDSFTYEVCDDGDSCAEATVNITVASVNDAPTAEDDEADIIEDTPDDIDVLANDEDADGDSLSVSILNAPENGRATVNTDESIRYAPDADYNGDDELTYRISDGKGGNATAAVSIAVTPVADDLDANPDSATTDEDTPKVIDVLANDNDADGEDLTVEIVGAASKGEAVVGDDNKVTYTPDANENGSDSFTYKVCGANDRCSGAATVNITITPVNDAPSAANDADRTRINKAVNVNVLANDTDPDGDNLSAAVVGQPAKGRVVRNSNGTLKYTPPRNFVGNVSFTYRASDGNGGSDTATVRITVARR